MSNHAVPIVDLDSPGHDVVLWAPPPEPVVIDAELVETKPVRARQAVVATPKPARKPRWTFPKNGHTWCRACRCRVMLARCSNLQCGNYWEPGSVTRRAKAIGGTP